MNKQKGFTLVELLVVIAIVAILAGALLIAINPQSMIQKSRDSKRLSDIDSLVKAVNLALADGEITLEATGACDDCTSNTGDRTLLGDGYVKYVIPPNKTGLSKFIPTLPIDPLNDATYYYTFGSTLTDFEVNVILEHTDNRTKMEDDGGNNVGAYEMGTSLTIIP